MSLEYKNYLVSESVSYESFAVVRGFSNDTLKERTSLAVKENFCFKSVESEILSDRNGKITLTCKCTDDDDEIIIKEIELNLVAIYE